MVKKKVDISDQIKKLEDGIAELKASVKGTDSTHVVVTLDRSGSMASCAKGTVDGFNEYLGILRADTENKYFITFFQFDTDIKGVSVVPVYEYKPLEEVPTLEYTDFQPRGGTPLYDAVGVSIEFAETTDKEGQATILVVLTDGGENASVKFTQGQIKTILTAKQKNHGWTVFYVGANQDAWSVGAGIGSQNNFNFVAASSTSNFRSLGAMTSASSTASASGVVMDSAQYASLRTSTYKEEEKDVDLTNKSTSGTNSK